MEVVGAVEAHKKITFDLYSITSLVSESIILTPVALFFFRQTLLHKQLNWV